MWGVVGCPAVRRPRSRGPEWPPGHVLSKTISINSTMDFIDSMDFEGTYRPSPPHQSPSIHEIHVIHGPKKRAGGGATPSWGQRVGWMLCRGCWRTPGAWSVVAVLQPATVGRGDGRARWAMRRVRMGGCRGGRALKQPDYFGGPHRLTSSRRKPRSAEVGTVTSKGPGTPPCAPESCQTGSVPQSAKSSLYHTA
jgi:hypothetical protein